MTVRVPVQEVAGAPGAGRPTVAGRLLRPRPVPAGPDQDVLVPSRPGGLAAHGHPVARTRPDSPRWAPHGEVDDRPGAPPVADQVDARQVDGT